MCAPEARPKKTVSFCFSLQFFNQVVLILSKSLIQSLRPGLRQIRQDHVRHPTRLSFMTYLREC